MKGATAGQCNWFLAGVTSFGKVPCGTAPSVYTDVTTYREWIVQTVTKLERRLRSTYRSGWTFRG